MTAAQIRPAHAGDAEALHELHCDTWREAYADLVPEAVLAHQREHGLSGWQRTLGDPAGDTVWLAHRGGVAVGFASASAAGTGQVRSLHLWGLYVRAGEYGLGTGANLLQLAVGDAPCYLWVAAENLRAQAFYRKHGFDLDGAEQQVARWGDLVTVRMVR
ncbi:MAG TPA: GNAT family N-acetyltransferase [Candidatus Ruania gallistercoris]|uniref:GNAT family N-acetyltransferase n=1 Tax=Candidatus Ruania gallistercoris TaxID=2838746 RepID=A0A9D2EAE0_9MICO|nr:GNAT family N-acetyltransferase [Candidatus Ruania gallistercoris]